MDILRSTGNEDREQNSENILKQSSELNKQKLAQLGWQVLDGFFDGKILKLDIEQLLAINKVLSSFIYTYLPNRYMYYSCYSSHLLKVLSRISKSNMLPNLSVNDILAYARRVALYKCGLSSNDKTIVRAFGQTVSPEFQKLFQPLCKEFYQVMRELYTGYNQHDHWFVCLMLDDQSIQEIVQAYKQMHDVSAEKIRSKTNRKTTRRRRSK